jgi:hypothetical protein
MTIDERIERELEDEGFEPETDEFSFEFQTRLDAILAEERLKSQQMPPRPVERLHGIML